MGPLAGHRSWAWSVSEECSSGLSTVWRTRPRDRRGGKARSSATHMLVRPPIPTQQGFAESRRTRLPISQDPQGMETLQGV